jgi:hypothetical protein
MHSTFHGNFNLGDESGCNHKSIYEKSRGGRRIRRARSPGGGSGVRRGGCSGRGGGGCGGRGGGAALGRPDGAGWRGSWRWPLGRPWSRLSRRCGEWGLGREGVRGAGRGG